MTTNNSVNMGIKENADGGEISLGVTARILKWLGAAITLTGSGSNVYTFPAATSTLIGSEDKAAGSDLDTGTDDAKFATAKAIKDAHNVPSVAPGTDGNVLTSDGTDWTSAAPAAGSTAMTFGSKKGLVLSNGTDATNDINIAAGKIRSSDDTTDIVLASAIAGKQLDATWAVGAAAGMRASGAAIADTTYHIFAILRPDTGVVDIAADTSVTGANIAANTNVAYTKFRRIGSIIRVSGAILLFTEYASRFTLKVFTRPLSGGTQTSPTAFTLGGIPLGLKVDVFGTVAVVPATSGSVWIVDPDAALTANVYAQSVYSPNTSPAFNNIVVTSNVSAQLSYWLNNGTGFMDLRGWIELWQV